MVGGGTGEFPLRQLLQQRLEVASQFARDHQFDLGSHHGFDKAAGGLDAAVQVDGGIGPANIADARAFGADLLVSASAIFGAADPVASYADLAERVASA